MCDKNILGRCLELQRIMKYTSLTSHHKLTLLALASLCEEITYSSTYTTEFEGFRDEFDELNEKIYAPNFPPENSHLPQ